MSSPTCSIPIPSQYGPTSCGTPLDDGTHICPSCASDAAARIRRDVPDALSTLQDAITLAVRFRRDVVRRARDDDHQKGDRPDLGAHGRLPLDWAAVERRDQLVGEVTRWLRPAYSRLWPGVPFVLPSLPPSAPEAAAVWLAEHLQQLVGEPWITTMVVRLDRRVRAALAACDRPDDRVHVTCPTCGSRVPVDADPAVLVACPGWVPTTDGSRVRCEEWGTQAWWIERCAPERDVVPAARLPLLLEAYGFHIEPATIRQWVSREQISPLKDDDGQPVTDPNGRPVYSVADVAVVAGQHAARRRTGRAV